MFLRATRAASCAPTYEQGDDDAATVIGGQGSYQWGAFSRNVSVEPHKAGTMRLCAYLAPGASSVP